MVHWRGYAENAPRSAVGGETAAFSVTQAFTHDKVNRLKTFTEGAKSETNDYDALGCGFASVGEPDERATVWPSWSE